LFDRPLSAREALTLGAVTSLMVFAFDLTQPLGVDGSAPYAILPLLGLVARSQRMVIVLAVVGTAMTFLGMLLSPAGVTSQIVLLNRLMSVVLVWLAAGIAVNHLAIGDRLRGRLENQAARDPLTDLFNRRHIFGVVENELQRYHRYGECCALILIDADFFKRVNDEHGHPAGDATLCRIADICRRSVRDSDAVGRFGGEEFIVVLRHTDAAAAVVVAERIRTTMAREEIVWQDRRVHLTLSLGVAQVGPECASFDDLLKAADQALYAAKAAGRDRVAVARSAPRPLKGLGKAA